MNSLREVYSLHLSRVVFLTITDSGYSRSWTFYSGLRQIREKVSFEQVDSRKLIRSLLSIKKNYGRDTTYIIMSPSQVIVPISRLVLGKRLVLDAGWSLFEGTTISRGHLGFLGRTALKNYLIDFCASHLSQVVILESYLQKEYYCRLFLMPRRKCKVLYTGVDEKEFNPTEIESLRKKLNFKGRIVLFRGKFNPEAGLEVLAKATHEFKNSEIMFWVVAPGIPSDIVFSKNTYVDTNYYSKKEIASMYLMCDLSLGQLAVHPRLNRTIPHKAFESAYLGVPYLSARSAGILELFQEGAGIECFEPGDAKDLAIKIRSLLENENQRILLGKSMKEKYTADCAQAILAEKFLRVLGNLIE